MTWKDKTGAAALFSLSVSCGIWGIRGNRHLGSAETPAKSSGKTNWTQHPTACAAGFLNQPQSWTTIRLLFRNTNLFCIPELVRAAPPRRPALSLLPLCQSSWHYTGQRFGLLSPKPSMTHWPKRTRVPASLGASIPVCHFKAAACRPCLPSATWMQWGRKIKMLGSWGGGERKRKTLKTVSWKHMF